MTEYGTYRREMDDRWFGTPMTPEREANIRWGTTLSDALDRADENPDILVFRRSGPDGKITKVPE